MVISEAGGEDPDELSVKGRRRSMRAVLVPDTGIPRIRKCCLSSDTLRSSRLAGRGPGLTGEMLWFGKEFLTGDEELLLAVLDGPLELQERCSLVPLWFWAGG